MITEIKEVDRKNKLVTVKIGHFILILSYDDGIKTVKVEDCGKKWKHSGEIPAWMEGVARRMAVEAIRKP